MSKPKRTSNAVRILHRRYVGEDLQRKASLEQERVNAEVARTIFELRQQAGLAKKSWRNECRQPSPSSAVWRMQIMKGILCRC